ncbi:hypothetical protein K5N60_000248 [Vibrio parahaemolyticus]|nr:hypothetical protein [Vibrio parahaemolyticus]EHZ2779786.1 hypothetical protein [Vibrio parahaemolyticus]
MALRLCGSIRAIVRADGEEEEIIISASDFSLEGDNERHIGDGDYQYEALYVYHGGAVEIYFQATNFQGNISMYPYNISGNIEVVEDNLYVEALDFDLDDY